MVEGCSCLPFIVSLFDLPFLLNLQMDRNLDEAAMTVTDNHPYLDVVVGDASIEAYLVVERRVLDKVDASSCLVGLIAYLCKHTCT